MADPVSPALNATNDGRVPTTRVEPVTSAIAKNNVTTDKSTQQKVKQAGPFQGDTFAASLGHGGKGCEPLANVNDIPADVGAVGSDEAAEAAKRMKNLLYAPTHKSYEKNVHTKGHAPSTDELKCTAYVMPAVLRDNTKFARPIVPVVCVMDNGDVRLTYVVYGNDEPEAEKLIMYNLDAMHGVALSTNVRRYLGRKGLWCRANLIDHQVRYVLTMLHKIPGMNICVDYDWKSLYGSILSSNRLTTSLLVVDGLSAATCKTLRGAYMVELLGEEHKMHESVLLLSVHALETFSSCCNDTYVHDEMLYPLLDLAVRNIKDRVPLTEVDGQKPESKENGKKTSSGSASHSNKRPPLDDSDGDDVALSLPKKAKPAPPEAPANTHGKKKNHDDEEDEQEMSPSEGSDAGTDSEEEEDEDEDSEEDSEEESDDSDEDDVNPKSVAPFASPKILASPKWTADAVAPTAPNAPMAASAAIAAASPRSVADKPDGGEKAKRKPAKSRRQSMEKMITSILLQGKGLDDTVPAQNHDKLTSRIAEVEQALRPFVEEGRVEHVKPLLESSWGLISELFTIITAIGRAGGPIAPDAAASRKLALSMGRLFDTESHDMEDLSRDLTAWASKMTTLVANRAQVALQAESDARQLANVSGAGSSTD